MPRTTLTPINTPDSYATAGVALTWTGADVANGNQFQATGREILLARNTDTLSHNVSVTSVADPYGRTGNITNDAIAAGAFRVYQQFPITGWMQSDGYVYLNGDHATIQFAVLRLPA